MSVSAKDMSVRQPGRIVHRYGLAVSIWSQMKRYRKKQISSWLAGGRAPSEPKPVTPDRGHHECASAV